MENQATFSDERLSVEEFLKKVGAESADIYPRREQDGSPKRGEKGQPLFCLVTDNGQFAYVPSELGQKLKDGEKVNKLFMTQVTTPGHDEPMWMLCESKSLAHFTVD